MNALSRTLIVGTALAASMAAGHNAMAANLACKPDVEVTNKKPASIKVLRFQYKVAGDNTIFSEGLNNRKLPKFSEPETWKSQKLGHAARGIVITESRVEFKDDNSGAGDGYGPARFSAWFPHTFTCDDNHTYKHDVE